jgi:chorismate dehydratase
VGVITSPIRVGAVSYLNAKPLYYGLCDLAPRVSLTMEVPSRLAEQLAACELDVALIPSVEYLRGVDLGYEIIPGFAIAARGPVRSVKLFSRVPIGCIVRLALDAGSRTSQVLARVWLDACHGVRPARIESLPLGVPVLESTADAVLAIGDRAMTVPHEPFHEVIDLAEAWRSLTGLPFVFALWVAGPGVDLGDLPEALARSRALGLAHAADLARAHGPRLGLDFTTCYDYLTRALSYELGEPELAGLRRFAQMAAGLGLAPEGVNLVFHRPRDLAARR